MNKSLVTLILLTTGYATAADPVVTTLTYIGNGTSDIATVNQWSYFSNLKDTSLITRSGASDETGVPYAFAGDFTYNEVTYNALTSITTEGNKDFTLAFTGDSFNVTVNEALYFNQIDATTASSSVWNFGSTGSITGATTFNNWGGCIRFKQSATVTFNVDVSDVQLNSVAENEVFSRNLMVASDKTESGIWNAANYLTLNATGLDNYESVGLVTSLDNLQKGQYGYMIESPKDNDIYAGDSITFVFRAIPEPTTATLSLLALAGLAARRRRK